MSAEQIAGATPMPAWFIRMIGVFEVLGAIGLVLPGLLHIRTGLTALAAAGLAIIMIGAVAVTVQTMGVAMAIFPFVIGALALFVAYGRWRLAPQRAIKAAARGQA